MLALQCTAVSDYIKVYATQKPHSSGCNYHRLLTIDEPPWMERFNTPGRTGAHCGIVSLTNNGR